ncbi:immunoglobulin-like domain-containing protein, partial [Anaerotignum sp.]
AAEPDFSDIRFIWVKREEPISAEKVRPYLSWENRGEEFLAQNVGAASVFLDGKEKKLKYPLYRKQGKTMIAAEDLANVIGGHYALDEWERELTLYADALKNSVGHIWIDRQSRKTVGTGSSYFIEEYKMAFKDSEGVWYIPLREMAEGVLYDVSWKKMADTEYFMLESPKKPQLAAEVSYDAEKNVVFLSLINWTQDTYLYGDEFFLQKWDGSQWQRVPMNREVCYAYPADQELPGISEDSWIAASRTIEHSMVVYEDGNGLSPGRYRIYKEIIQKNSTDRIVYHIGAEFLVE